MWNQHVEVIIGAHRPCDHGYLPVTVDDDGSVAGLFHLCSSDDLLVDRRRSTGSSDRPSSLASPSSINPSQVRVKGSKLDRIEEIGRSYVRSLILAPFVAMQLVTFESRSCSCSSHARSAPNSSRSVHGSVGAPNQSYTRWFGATVRGPDRGIRSPCPVASYGILWMCRTTP